MKKEFKPGDKAMIEVEILKIDNTDVPYLVATPCGSAWMREDRIHPIPTPPRPLRVDELVKGEKYTFNRCGETIAGQFTGLIVGENAILEVCNNAGKPYGANVDESQNIRPVERVVSDEELDGLINHIAGVGYSYRFNNDDMKLGKQECRKIIRGFLDRHFMKGGSDESK